MAKWADYCISAVRYTQDGAKIALVRVHRDTGESISASEDMSRDRAISLLRAKSTFCTILKNSEGKWLKGADVSLVGSWPNEYIRTDKNNTTRDNLGSLPTF